MSIIHGLLCEPTPEMVGHNRNSALLVMDQSFMDWARFLTNSTVPTAYKFPEATQRWGQTVAKDQTAFNLGMNVSQPFFDYLRQEKAMNGIFSSYMSNVASAEGVSFKHLVAGFNWAGLSPGATVVDVGGSGGHASLALAKQFPHLNFIVQDLPETIANAKNVSNGIDAADASVCSRIKFMAHDFFQPQPAEDGDVYLLRMIIHDWPDKEAVKILGHLRTALRKPGARIVIMDTVLPQPGSIPLMQERQLRVRDLTMIQVFNAKEREIEDWHALARATGLRVARVEQPPGSAMGVLQLERQDEMISHVNGDQIATAETSVDDTAHGQFSGLVNGVNGNNGTNGTHGHNGLNGVSQVVDTNGARVDDATKAKPVLIIGGGIGGLCLAQGLRKAGISFQVFEKDLSEAYRPQGYRLKLEADAAAALRENLPTDVYQAFEASCAISAIGETDFEPISGSVIKSRAGGGLAGQEGLRASFTADRTVLRSVLMTGIEDSVVFGKDLASYEETPNEYTVVAKFKDGSHAEGSFLVGADGIRSCVRKQLLPKHKFIDTGAVCIYGKTPMTPDLLSRFPEKGLRWMTVCADHAPLIQSILIGDSPLTLLCEPIRFSEASRASCKLPDDYIYWVLIGRRAIFGTPDDVARMASGQYAPADSARLSLELTSEWHGSLRSLFELQDAAQCSTLQVASATPDMPAWEPSGLVTVLGDAIHAMSPCGGVGANTALRDAAELARVLAGIEPVTADQIGTFEEDMRKRMVKSLMRSFAGSKKMFDQRPFGECAGLEI